MRRDLITRTISGTKAIVKVADKNDAIVEKEVMLSKVLEGKKLEKAIKAQLSEDEVLIRIASSETINKLYGITPADFMAHAIELDPATREAIETTNK